MATNPAPEAVDSTADGRARRRTPPTRTCVGCRRRAVKSDLLRIVADEGTVVPDLRGHGPGRGAYLHRDVDCLDLAERRRALSRALRLPGGLDLRALRAAIEAGTSAPPGSAGTPDGTPTHDTEAGRDGDERSMKIQR